MVCRHIFFICVNENIKDISKLRISNRCPVSLEGPSEKHFCTLPEPVINKIENLKGEELTQIFEISTEKHELENDQQEVQTQVISSQIRRTTQSPVNNFEKVLATKGAPKGIYK